MNAGWDRTSSSHQPNHILKNDLGFNDLKAFGSCRTLEKQLFHIKRT
jgi:hypothetical protein